LNSEGGEIHLGVDDEGVIDKTLTNLKNNTGKKCCLIG